jgi:hypothetical protein
LKPPTSKVLLADKKVSGGSTNPLGEPHVLSVVGRIQQFAAYLNIYVRWK